MYFSRRAIYLRLDDKHWVLFSTLSGAIDIVEGKLINSLREEKWSEISLKTKELLHMRGFLFETKEEEISEFLKICELVEEYDKRLAPEFVIIPTYACNLTCRYCYEWNLPNRKEVLSNELLRLIWKAMDSIVGSYVYRGTPRVVLMGGEPLLPNNQEQIKEILVECFLRQWPVEIITNGTTLTQYVSLLEKYRIDGVQVTIDGIREIHDQRRIFRNGKGSFNQIIEGITALLKGKIKVYIRVNLDSENLDHLPLLARFIQKNGWLDSKIVFPYIYAMSDAGCLGQLYILKETEVLRKIMELSEKFPELNIFDWRFHGLDQIMAALRGEIFSPLLRYCAATKNQYVFDLMGKIYACWWGAGRQEFEIGEFIPWINWHGNTLEKWRNRSILNIYKCQDCKFALICGGGCAEKAIREEGGIYQPHCSSFQEILSLSLPFLIKRYFLSLPNIRRNQNYEKNKKKC